MKKMGLYIKILVVGIIFWTIKSDINYEIKEKNNFYGIIDDKQREIIPFVYQKILKLDKNFILFKEKNIEILGKHLEKIDDILGEDIYPLNKYNFMLKNGEKYFVWSRGKIYEVNHSIEQVYDNYIVERKEGKAVVKNLLTDDILFDEYDGVCFQDRNNIIVEKNGKYGVIDIKNNKKIDFQYDNISPLLKDKYYIVENEYKSGVIDKNGETLIPSMYDMIEKIEKKYVIVYLEKGMGVVNLRNEIIIPFEYDDIEIKDEKIYCYFQKKLKKVYFMK